MGQLLGLPGLDQAADEPVEQPGTALPNNWRDTAVFVDGTNGYDSNVTWTLERGPVCGLKSIGFIFLGELKRISKMFSSLVSIRDLGHIFKI